MTKDKEAGRKARANKPVEDADFGRPSLDPCQRNEWYSIQKKAQTFALLCLAGLLSWFATPISVGASPALDLNALDLNAELGFDASFWAAVGASSGLDVGLNASEVPQLINYSGKLSGAEGEPLPTGDYTLSFSIYDHATAVPCGVAGDRNKVCARRVWGPQIFDGNSGRGHGNQVPVVKGFFSAILGPYDTHGSPIAQAFMSSGRFIEVTFEDGAPNLPRQQVFSTPFALRSSGETPVGGIIMFSGRASELPENWRVCRGQVVTDPSSPLNGKRLPDLRGLFVRGAEHINKLGRTGGRDMRDTHRHSFHGSLNIGRNSVDRVITNGIFCNDKNQDGVCTGDLAGEAKLIGLNFATNTRYRAVVLDSKNRGDSHSHVGSAHGFTQSDLGTDLDNRPRHVNLHYIIRIK